MNNDLDLELFQLAALIRRFPQEIQDMIFTYTVADSFHWTHDDLCPILQSSRYDRSVLREHMQDEKRQKKLLDVLKEVEIPYRFTNRERTWVNIHGTVGWLVNTECSANFIYGTILKDCVPCFKYLQDCGLTTMSCTGDNRTLISIAIQYHAVKIVELLVPEFTAHDLEGYSRVEGPLLQEAAESEQWDIFKPFLTRALQTLARGNVDICLFRSGRTHYDQSLDAARYYYHRLYCYDMTGKEARAFREAGFDVSLAFEDVHGENSWHFGVMNADPDYLEFLREFSPHSFKTPDFHGWTPLELAAVRHRLDAVKFLVALYHEAEGYTLTEESQALFDRAAKHIRYDSEEDTAEITKVLNCA